MMTEADTCRKYVLPKLIQAGWDTDPHSFTEQRTFTDGRIIISGSTVRRRAQKRADYLLRYTRDFTIAVVEAKAHHRSPGDGLQQAKEYAEVLRLKFAYATNGMGIIEFDYITGMERTLDAFPSPQELWSRLCAAEGLTNDATMQRLLTPFHHLAGKSPRYYQEIAINRAVQAILQGKRRILLTMATGTGKTIVAFQICWKLWSSRWNRTGEHRRPKILYLADRNILIDDPKDKIFAPFGEARWKIEHAQAIKSRDLYFAIYQAIARDEYRPGLYREYARDFFDLIIVDECHRGSARDNSNWREILAYFDPAYQVGMTATPLREDNRDTYAYFGPPLYTYSLRQGIEDGFLAPYRVHRVMTTYDAAGWRPSQGELDRYSREIPDREYHTPDFEREVALRARTEAIARHLTEFLKTTDRFAKTIVFCSATRLFADPDFDGDPALITEERIDEAGETIPTTYEVVEEDKGIPSEEGEEDYGTTPFIPDDSAGERRKYYVDGGHVEIVTHLVYELNPDGKQLRVVKYTDYAAEKVRTLYRSAAEIHQRWADPEQRSQIIASLEERGIIFDELASAANQPEADPFELLCHLAFNAPLRTRRERADRLRKEQRDFFVQYSPQARTILDELLQKYAAHGTAQFLIPDVLKLPPISDHGNVLEIVGFFGGPEKLREAVNQLQTLLYAA